jgi:hypothetical protein
MAMSRHFKLACQNHTRTTMQNRRVSEDMGAVVMDKVEL